MPRISPRIAGLRLATSSAAALLLAGAALAAAPLSARETAPETAAPATEARHIPPGRISGGSGRGAVRSVLTPGVARGCRIAMGVTMAFMLIIMI